MKNTIITAVLFLATFGGFAQENASLFQVEEQSYLLLEGYMPNTTVECFSTPGGGKQTDIIKLNAAGAGRQIFDAGHSPAFELKKKATENAVGTDKVIRLDRQEFIAKNITLDIIAQEVKLSWDAKIPCGNHIEFQILKKEAGGDYKVVKIFTGTNGAVFNKYNFSETYQTNTSYMMQIMKDGKKIRYATGPIGKASTTDWVRVYPTVCSDKLYIDLQVLKSNTEYAVTDMSGKMIHRAPLNDMYSMIDISKLSSGNYLIAVLQGNEKKSFKITKN